MGRHRCGRLLNLALSLTNDGSRGLGGADRGPQTEIRPAAWVLYGHHIGRDRRCNSAIQHRDRYGELPHRRLWRHGY
jgi:hypothetical protein